MLISEKHKILFVHVQKTGGTTIEHVLRHNIPDIKRIAPKHAYLKDAPVDISQYWVFSFVRNPLDRLVSRYMFAKQYRSSWWRDIIRCFDNKLFMPSRYPGIFRQLLRYFRAGTGDSTEDIRLCYRPDKYSGCSGKTVSGN